MNSGPTQKPTQPIKFIRPLDDFSAAALDDWINQLPLSDVDGACEAIHGLLRKLNMTDGLDCLERQRIVEQIRPPAVSLLAMSSEKHLPASTLFPLSSAQHKHTQRSVDMCLELANAYRRIVTSGTFFSDKVMSDAERAQTIYRALQSYGLALLRSLERYESPPEGFWLETYAFYRFAEGHRLQNYVLPTPEIEGATVDSQFKQILLLALSSHQHHSPDEIRQFYIALMLIAKDAEILGDQENEGEAALFYFDMGNDKAPRPMKRAKPTRHGERRYLFTGKMLRHARKYFSNPAHRATERFKLRSTVIMSLLDTLSAAEKRRFVRMPAAGNRKFVVGLPRLIKELSGEHPSLSEPHTNRLLQPDLLQEDDEIDEIEIVLGQIEEGRGDSIWVTDSSPDKALASNYSSLSERLSPGIPADIVLTGSLLNSSAGGYCMLWLDTLISGARVGEVVGVYEEEGRIYVGVLRWLHQKTRAELVIGVELLSPDVEVVTIENITEGGYTHRGLYLYANERLSQPASLLSGPGSLMAGQHLVLIGPAASRLPFRLEKLLEETLSFQLFSLSSPANTA